MNVSSLNERYKAMTETPVPRLVMRLAVPTIVSMVVTALYNVVDAAFVGRLSTEATAGIGISFAYMTFIQANGFFFGHGSGNYISRALGAKNYHGASKMAAVGFLSPMAIGVAAAVAGLVFLPDLARLLGAPESVVPYACDYLRYIVLATPFMMSALTLNNQLRLQGNARFAMVGILFGAVLNIILDPLFIFVLEMGVTGASLATAISQLVSWGILLYATLVPGSISPVRYLVLRSKGRKMNQMTLGRCYYEIFRGGLPSLCRQAFNCLSAVFLNYAAARYAQPGNEASTVAAFAIVTRVMMFAFSVVLGFCQGFQPVCGFNYGARLYKRVRQSFLFTTSVSTVFLAVISVCGYVWAPGIIAIFRDSDPVLMEVGIATLRWQCIAFPLVGMATATNMLFQNIRMTFKSTLLSMSRQGLFLVPAILVLPRFFGLEGVEMAQAVADVCTFVLALPFAISISRQLKTQK